MKSSFSILLLSSLLLVGCATTPTKKFYLLDYVPSTSSVLTGKDPLPFKIRVKDLRIAEAYKRTEIVYRQSAHELRFYNYHQWAVKPERLISDMIFKHINKSRVFKDVSRSLVDFRPDYTLTGEILAIEEYDNKEKWYAHLALTFQLENERTRKLVWQQSYDLRKMVNQHEPVFVVRELSYLLEHAVDKVIEEIFQKLSGTASSPETAVPQASSYGQTKEEVEGTIPDDDDSGPEDSSTDNSADQN